ncbi:hypothetical protein ACIP10_30555 [Streptomyces galbus]|uniref:hypothetical protein n=1 Tax=Streptomyces galbus TaxID=33898 RepID=UPI0037FC3974
MRHDAETAAAVMREAGMEPLEPYPGTAFPWKSRCTKCASIVSPRLGSLTGLSRRPARKRCADRATGEAQRHDEDLAVVEMRVHGFEPQEPYRGVKYPWRCLCHGCGTITSPTFGSILAGQSGCRACADLRAGAARREDPERAAASMREADLEPLEPYRTGSIRGGGAGRCGRCAEGRRRRRSLDFLKLLREEAPEARWPGIDTAIVNALLDAADADTGFRRHNLLTRAATVARDRGLSELRACAEMALQQTDPDSLGWIRLRRQLILPPGLIAGARAHIDAAADLTDALWRTTLDVHPVMREDSDDAHPLDGLLRIPRTRINTAGPIQVAPPVEADDDQVVGLQVRAMDVVGLLAAEQIDRVYERFEPDEAELIGALVHDAVLPLPRARILADAFGYFWLDELDAAVCIALPQVEQILRQLLRPRVPIVSVAKGQSPGTVAQMGALIRSMPAAGYPRDWSRALELLLVDSDRGMNLRNDVCHGLVDTPPKHRVALILQAALYLLSYAHGQRSPAAAAP